MKSPSATASFWLFWIIVPFSLIQLFPQRTTSVSIGTIVFMFGALILAILIHVFLVAVTIEAILNRVPRILLLVPALAYGGYYALYAYDSSQIAGLSAKLKAENPEKIMDFDDDKNSLVLHSADSVDFAGTHFLPVTFDANKYYFDGYLSLRVIPKNECDLVKYSKDHGFTRQIIVDRKPLQNVCILLAAEGPTRPVVSVTKGSERFLTSSPRTTFQTTFEFSAEGRVIGVFKSERVERMSIFPFLSIDCSYPYDKCFSFLHKLVALDGILDSVDRQKFDDPIGAMLRIRKFTAADIDGFTGFEQNAEDVRIIIGKH